MKQIDDWHEHQFDRFRPVSGSGEDLLPSDRGIEGGSFRQHKPPPLRQRRERCARRPGERNEATDAILRQAAHQDVGKRRGGLAVARVEGAAAMGEV